MATLRFQKSGLDSFYGDYLYQNIVPQGHFLRQLRELVPWQRFTYRLLKYYRKKGQVGRPPIDPAIVLKMLLLSYLYNLSERHVEELCNYYLPAKCFLGLAIDAQASDHATLTVFKERILENGKLRAYERMLTEIIRIAQEAGIVLASAAGGQHAQHSGGGPGSGEATGGRGSRASRPGCSLGLQRDLHRSQRGGTAATAEEELLQVPRQLQ